MCSKFWSGNLKGRDHLDDGNMGGRITLEWILGKWGGNMGNDASGSR